MQSASSQRWEIRKFLRKLAVALPANLALFWLELDGSMPAVLILSVLSALIGAFLLTALDRPLFANKGTPLANSRRRATVHEFPRYTSPAPRF